MEFNIPSQWNLCAPKHNFSAWGMQSSIVLTRSNCAPFSLNHDSNRSYLSTMGRCGCVCDSFCWETSFPSNLYILPKKNGSGMSSARRKASSSGFWFECLGDSSPVFGSQLECSRDRWYIFWYQSIDLAIEQVFRCKLRYLFVVLLFSWKKSKGQPEFSQKGKRHPAERREACRSGTWFRLSLVKKHLCPRDRVSVLRFDWW